MWETFRGSNQRNSATTEKAPTELNLLWENQGAAQVNIPSELKAEWQLSSFTFTDRITAPVVADGRVFVGVLVENGVVAVCVGRSGTVGAGICYVVFDLATGAVLKTDRLVGKEWNGWPDMLVSDTHTILAGNAFVYNPNWPATGTDSGWGYAFPISAGVRPLDSISERDDLPPAGRFLVQREFIDVYIQ